MSELFQQVRTGVQGVQLVCLPYLGGYASAFMPVINFLEMDVDILVANPPGHGSSKEKPVDELKILVDRYAIELKQKIEKPWIILGHSMGGVIAYFLTLRLQELGCLALPKALILSASVPPRDFIYKQLSTMTDEELLEHLVASGGIPNVLTVEMNLLKYFLPVFRADAKILNDAFLALSSPLNIPSYCLWGEQDHVAKLASIVGWSNYFQEQIKLIPIQDGNHLFLHSQAKLVAEIIQTILMGA